MTFGLTFCWLCNNLLLFFSQSIFVLIKKFFDFFCYHVFFVFFNTSYSIRTIYYFFEKRYHNLLLFSKKCWLGHFLFFAGGGEEKNKKYPGFFLLHTITFEKIAYSFFNQIIMVQNAKKWCFWRVIHITEGIFSRKKGVEKSKNAIFMNFDPFFPKNAKKHPI